MTKSTRKGAFPALLAAAIIAFAFVPAVATESGSMRCGGGIVSPGDTAAEVIGKCGQPAATLQREEKKVATGANGKGEKSVTTTVIEEWTFNFGPNQFQYQLSLENGRVARIESLGYGY